MIQVFSML